MNRKAISFAVAAQVAAALYAGPSAAQTKYIPGGPFGIFNGGSALTVVIGCRIENVKEIVLVNSTTAAIAAGTTISYDVVRYRSTLHYSGSIVSPLLPPGASVRLGREQSSSCTAWYRRPAVLSQ